MSKLLPRQRTRPMTSGRITCQFFLLTNDQEREEEREVDPKKVLFSGGWMMRECWLLETRMATRRMDSLWT